MFSFGKQRRKLKSTIWLTLIICVVLVCLLWVGVNQISASSSSESLKFAEKAVKRALIQCYAIEGRYPDSIDYLAEHYGLILNENYFYHYAAFAANLMPQVAVYQGGASFGT